MIWAHEESWKKMIKITILDFRLFTDQECITEYIFNRERCVFNESFEISVVDLHQVFFETIKIVFIKKAGFFRRKSEIGGVSINVRSLLESSPCKPEPYLENSKMANSKQNPTLADQLARIHLPEPVISPDEHIIAHIDIVKSSDLYCADYFQRKSTPIGILKVKITTTINTDIESAIEKARRSTEMMKRMTIWLIRFDWLLERFTSSYMARILNLSFHIQQGSATCKLKALAGLTLIQMHSNKIYAMCNGLHEGECPDTNCYKLYKHKFGRDRSKKLLRILNYSAAAYSTSLMPIFGPKKLRTVKNVLDRSKRIVLERALIKESDIIKISGGTVSSMGFVAFFDNCDRMVVSFRGSCSKEDIVKILDASYTNFLDGFVHEGFLYLAISFLITEMESLLIEMKKRKCHNVLFTGHSMGGAIGIVSYLILKNIDRFKDRFNFDVDRIKKLKIKVVGFSVPPTVSENIANREDMNIEVYNYEKDVIPQISFGSILDLKFLSVSVGFKRNAVTNVKKFLEEVNEIRKHLKESNIHEKLYCPGRIFHIRSGKDGYGFREVPGKFFDEIQINIRGITNHFMSKLGDVFEMKR